LLTTALIAASRQVNTASMDNGANFDLTEQIAAALDWWREAGVDGDLGDTPQRWIAQQKPSEAATSDAPTASIVTASSATPAFPPAVDRGNWPQDFGMFAPWWLADPWLDEGRTSDRVAPRGVANAELMVLVAEPERDDGDVLLAGPQGHLLEAMLMAMGIAPEASYFASVLPRPMPHADWNMIAARGLGELARHHIALAAPKRLIVFGNNILSLLGHDPANKPAAAAQFEHGGDKMPLLAARDLAVLLGKPRWKAGFWQSWLEWTENA
jgi:uracil-DNA glycosylase